MKRLLLLLGMGCWMVGCEAHATFKSGPTAPSAQTTTSEEEVVPKNGLLSPACHIERWDEGYDPATANAPDARYVEPKPRQPGWQPANDLRIVCDAK